MKTSVCLLLLTVVAVLSGCRSVSPSGDGSFRIVSYNIHHGAAMDGKLAISNIARRIAGECPRFAGVQEVDQKTSRVRGQDTCAILAQETGLHATFAKAIAFGGGEYGNALLSREEPLRVRRIPLPGEEPRVLLLCEFEDCWVGVTHLAVDSEKNRLDSISTIKKAVAECEPKPVFLMGDWNASPDSQVLMGLKNFMSVVSDESAATFHGGTRHPTELANRNRCIDYIAVDTAHRSDYVVRGRRTIPDRYSSDHMPIVVEVEPASTSRRVLPVGVFDSGIGGLSVLEQILAVDRFDNATGEEKPDGKPDFENERFVYFGDQANMPYGRYDAEGKPDFLRELVVRDAKFVLSDDGHAPSKIVVIACNTATAYGLESVKALPKKHGEKVIGVVNAGVEGALDVTRDAKSPYAIAVMATPGTIASGVYERTIRAELKARGVKVAVDVANRGGIGLAEAVENDEPGMRDCARTNVIAMVEGYRARGGDKPIKVMILGCTHYPFVLDVIKSTLADMKKDAKYAPLIADDLVFLDPAVNTAVACYRSLKADGLLVPEHEQGCRDPRMKAFVSVGKNGPLPDAVKYGRDLEDDDYGTKIVPLTWEIMPKGAPDLIKAKMPLSARLLEQ